MTSHQRHPLVHPTTRTRVLGGSQVTSGNARSGPERRLTACVVNALCADADAANSVSETHTHADRSAAERRREIVDIMASAVRSMWTWGSRAPRSGRVDIVARRRRTRS